MESNNSSMSFYDFVDSYAEDFAKYGNAMTGALSEAAQRYAERVDKLHEAGILDAEQRYQAASEEFGKSFKQLSEQSKAWAEAADSAKNPGIADIMRKYSDGFAAQAEKLLSDTGTAASRWNGLSVTDAEMAANWNCVIRQGANHSFH